MEQQEYMVAVIGAGPAGLFASRQLAKNGVQVALFNRDIKPGGLAEYGIYPAKVRMKNGLRKQFTQILSLPNIDYFGNVKVSSGSSLFLTDLVDMGFHAILVTTGAQGTKWLNLPGEQLPGVYHAKDLVFHYNLLPPYSTSRYLIGPEVVLVGAGNVMMDIARYLIRDRKVKKVTVVVRRGPGEIKFTRQELEHVAANIDQEALENELNRVTPIIQAVGQEIEPIKQFFKDGLPNALEPVSSTSLHFNFLTSPTKVLGEWTHGVNAVEVEENTLVKVGDKTKPKSLGTTRSIPADTVVFAIGDTIDKRFSLPIEWDSYSVDPNPSFPIDGISFEAYDKEAQTPVKSVFVAGWARQASTGLVGYARKDGETAAQAILKYLETLPAPTNTKEAYSNFKKWISANLKNVFTNDDICQLQMAELKEIESQGVEDFKFASNDEMVSLLNK